MEPRNCPCNMLQHVTTRYNMLQHVTSTSMFRDCRPAALLPAPSVLNTRPGAILPWSWLKTGFHAEVQTSQLPRRLDDNPCIIQETHMDTYMVYMIIKICIYIIYHRRDVSPARTTSKSERIIDSRKKKQVLVHTITLCVHRKDLTDYSLTFENSRMKVSGLRSSMFQNGWFQYVSVGCCHPNVSPIDGIFYIILCVFRGHWSRVTQYSNCFTWVSHNWDPKMIQVIDHCMYVYIYIYYYYCYYYYYIVLLLFLLLLLYLLLLFVYYY